MIKKLNGEYYNTVHFVRAELREYCGRNDRYYVTIFTDDNETIMLGFQQEAVAEAVLCDSGLVKVDEEHFFNPGYVKKCYIGTNKGSPTFPKKAVFHLTVNDGERVAINCKSEFEAENFFLKLNR